MAASSDMGVALSRLNREVDRRQGGRPLMIVWAMFLGCRHSFKPDSAKRALLEGLPAGTSARVFCDPSPLSDVKAYMSLASTLPLSNDSAYIRGIVDAVAVDMKTHDVLLVGNSYGGGVATRVAQHLAARPGTLAIMGRLKLRTFGAICCSTAGVEHVDTIHYMYDDDAISLRASGLRMPGDHFFASGERFRYDPTTRIAWMKNLFFKVRGVPHGPRNWKGLSSAYQEIHRSYKFAWDANLAFVRHGGMDVHQRLTPAMAALLNQTLETWAHLESDGTYEPTDEYYDDFRRKLWGEHLCEQEYADKDVLRASDPLKVVDAASGWPPEDAADAARMCRRAKTKFNPRIRKGRCLKACVSQEEVHKKIADACEQLPAVPV